MTKLIVEFDVPNYDNDINDFETELTTAIHTNNVLTGEDYVLTDCEITETHVSHEEE